MSCRKGWTWHFQDPKFQNFLGEHAPIPCEVGLPLALQLFLPACIHLQYLMLCPCHHYHQFHYYYYDRESFHYHHIANNSVMSTTIKVTITIAPVVWEKENNQ